MRISNQVELRLWTCQQGHLMMGFQKTCQYTCVLFFDLFSAKHRGATFIPGKRVWNGDRYLSSDTSLSLACSITVLAYFPFE